MRFLFFQAFLAVFLVGIDKVRADDEDIIAHRPPSTTKVWIEMLDEPFEQGNVKKEEEVDLLREETHSAEVGEREDGARNLQQFLRYCDGIQTKILCTNVKTDKDCATDIVPYNKNGCYLYLKYTISITNKGNKDAKVIELTRQLNGEERDFSGMINKNFILKPRMRINISRTEYVDYCEAHNFIGTAAEVLADIDNNQATNTCVEHDIYVISGDISV